jgi:hypothetical protein
MRMSRLGSYLVTRLNNRHFPDAEVVWELGGEGGLCSATIGQLTVVLHSSGELEFDGPIRAELAAALCTHIANVLAENVPATGGAL